MSEASKCFLRCCKGLHPDIVLAHQTKIVVGRGPNTKIKDKRCSREQIALIADYQKFQVKLTQLGLNLGRFQDKELHKNESVLLNHGDKFDILSGEYEHKICFDPIPKKEDLKSTEEVDDKSSETPTKRKMAAAYSETRAPPTKQTKMSFKKNEIKIQKLDRSSDKVVWEQGADGQLYIMTYDDCQPSEKVRRSTNHIWLRRININDD